MFGSFASKVRAVMVPLSLVALLLVAPLGFQSCYAQSSASTSVPSPQPVLTQHITHPTHKDVLVPGSVSTIRWNANVHFKNVTLQLWDKTSWGYSHDLLTPCFPWGRNPFCGTIAYHAPNTGSFDWQIPNPANGSLGYGFPRNEQVFWVKIFVEDYVNEEIGNRHPVVSWSQNFAFAADGESGTVVNDEGTTTSSEGVPVLVTNSKSATSSLGPTTTAAAASATPTGSSPNRALMSPAAQSEALKLERDILLLAVLSLALEFI
ncbi:hypothetical protein K458DRAFT_43206 [Lentithecium fluviatile CBS 122367]|uniref:Uncharacterized protein n=1 Tax=Lentithecium fluviatile CBS 122367 TaxID=1168545 RepID=A0A6G1J135_9PLEO|nr:hypothetical protein K458DRAFT_43206 [Lentithecium fluviatile CBS 122367]